MALIQVTTDLSRVAIALEELVVILNRAFPAPPVEFQPAPLSDEEREALGFSRRNDEEAWRDEVAARRANGESDADIAWRAYAPRS